MAVGALLAANGSPAGHPGLYDVLVALHVVCAVAGFGAVAVSGAYGAIGRRARDEAGVEEVRRFFSSRSWVAHLLLVAPVFGVAAMAVRPGGSEFGALWAVAGLVIWVMAGALLLAVVRPSERVVRAAVSTPAGPGPAGRGPDASLRAGATRLMWAGAASDMLFVVALVLMVTQPG